MNNASLKRYTRYKSFSGCIQLVRFDQTCGQRISSLVWFNQLLYNTKTSINTSNIIRFQRSQITCDAIDLILHEDVQLNGLVNLILTKHKLFFKLRNVLLDSPYPLDLTYPRLRRPDLKFQSNLRSVLNTNKSIFPSGDSTLGILKSVSKWCWIFDSYTLPILSSLNQEPKNMVTFVSKFIYKI